MRSATLSAFTVLAMSMSTHAGTAIVPGQANIYGSGFGVPPDPDGGGGGVLPTEIVLTVDPGAWIEFPSVQGEVSCCLSDTTFNGPDGGPFASGSTSILPFNSLSGIQHADRTMFMVGVFLGANQPNGSEPPTLDFTGFDTFGSLAPELRQVFFIGDGLTGTGAGNVQQFFVPAGATRLYLGFADAFEFGNPDNPPGFYADNLGELSVDYRIVPAHAVSAVGLILGLGTLRRRRL